MCLFIYRVNCLKGGGGGFSVNVSKSGDVFCGKRQKIWITAPSTASLWSRLDVPPEGCGFSSESCAAAANHSALQTLSGVQLLPLLLLLLWQDGLAWCRTSSDDYGASCLWRRQGLLLIAIQIPEILKHVFASDSSVSMWYGFSGVSLAWTRLSWSSSSWF